MANKSLKILGIAGIIIGTAYVIGKTILEDKNAPIAVFKYTAVTEKIQRLK
jgi:xanthosine utilization system XapX-like protein